METKSNAYIESQTRAFAHNQEYPHDQELTRDIKKTAVAILGEDTITTPGEEWSEVEKKTWSHQEYVEFLRTADEETRKDIVFLAQRIEAYNPLRTYITNSLTGASEQSDHYINKGSNGSVFKIEHEGTAYAVKRGGVDYRFIRAFRRGEQIPNLSHLVAVDLDSQISVMNLVPGRPIDTLSFEERDTISPEHIKGLIDTVIKMHQEKLVMDPKPSNFLYDEEHGFSVVDYYAAGDKHMRHMANTTVPEEVMRLREVLTFRPWEKRPAMKYDSPEFQSWMGNRALENVSILNKFLDVLESDYPELLEASRGKVTFITTPLPEGDVFDTFRTRVSHLLSRHNPESSEEEQEVIE